MSSRILDLEDALKEKGAEQDILLSLFDKGTAVLIKWNNDEEWGVPYVSESVERLLGYKSSDFVNRIVDYIDLIHKDDLQRVCDEVDVAVQQGRDYFEHEPYRIYTKKGATKWVQDSTAAVKNEEGEITHFLGTIVDITAIKEKDKQLLQQYKLAQMGEMISMIAHQWRQPLNTISITASNLNLNIMLNNYDLSHKEEAKKFKEYLCENLNNVEAYTQILSKTIDDFRNFYKSDKNSMLLRINEPVEKALSIIQVSLINNGVKIRQVYRSTKKVNLFDSEIMHVILNILKNAEDNFKDKKIKNPIIDILSYDTLYGVVLEISDNGGGIPKSIINRIFEPYFSSKDNKVGTGLGLYMSKIIVEEHHGGTLNVSNNKEGACFSIELPA
ncbi:MAG: PAS domain-containing protein [Sulfurimonas sp.]|jgi:PAS domain S-box-containing protein